MADIDAQNAAFNGNTIENYDFGNGSINLMTTEGTTAWTEASTAATNATPVTALTWSRMVYLGSKDHAEEQCSLDSTGHDSADGTTYY